MNAPIFLKLVTAPVTRSTLVTETCHKGLLPSIPDGNS